MLYARLPTIPLPPTSSPSTLLPKTTTAVPSSAHSSFQAVPSPSHNSKVTTKNSKNSTSTALIKSATATISQRRASSKHAESKTEPSVKVSVKTVRSAPSTPAEFNTDMGKRSLSPSLPHNAADNLTRPPTPTSPVQIPKHTSRSRHFDTAHPVRRHSASRRKVPQHVHSPDALSPSVAALLAVTDIPRPRQSQKRTRKADKPLTVDEVIANEKQLSEKDFSWSLSRGSPMDVLLSPPESLDDDFGNGSEYNMGCSMTRTPSADSMPSLGGDSFVTDVVSSIESPRSSSPASSRRRMMSPIRRSLEPVSPSDTTDEHPLAPESRDTDELDFVALQKPNPDETTSSPLLPFKPLRAAFKSNLTASLRALRSAAKSFSSINFPSIPPDDFLTRSILTMDPKVPYADERRPPVTEEMPSAELRRYLNPTTRLSLQAQPGTLQAPGKYSASIQMQTYKIQRSRPTSNTSRSPYPPTSPQSGSSAASTQSPSRTPSQSDTPPVPAMRQREMRENPDFIRIAVMEMAMRRRGKLDSHKPGRARWALPPRKTSMRPYEIGADGVPERWIPITNN